MVKTDNSSFISPLFKTIIVHDNKIDKITIPYDTKRESQRVQNLKANGHQEIIDTSCAIT